MASITPKGLYVWGLTTDQFFHQQLADNFELIDTLLDNPASSAETLATLPTTSNFAGRLVMLSGADGGFPAWTLVRYDGSAWRNAGAVEILAALPTLNLYPGRIVVLSAAVGGFNAWDVVRYDGAAWDILGGWRKIDNGAGATNIKGVQIAGDVHVSDSGRGLVLTDRITGLKRRIYLDGGNLEMEQVT